MKQKTFDEEMKELFGGKVYRLSLSSGCTCPNRDGTAGTGGCIFCSAGGSGEFASRADISVSAQLEEAKKRVAGKLSRSFAGYMAYFQSFSGTYGPVERLEKLFAECLDHEEILALSVATRPDCLPPETVAMLARLNRRKPVWVELGLQTVHEDTAMLINRGYRLPVFEDAVRRLKAAGLRVVVHVIVGLPGEDAERTAETVRYLSRLTGAADGKPVCLIDGIKLQILQVLKGTRLAEMKKQDSRILPEYSPESYAALLKELLDILPASVTVHRLTGDPPKSLLISPAWTADKKRVLNTIRKTLQE